MELDVVTEKSGYFCGTMSKNTTSEPKMVIVTENYGVFSVTMKADTECY